MSNNSKTIKSTDTLEHERKMRAAAKLAAEILDMVAKHVKPGITTGELNELCHDMIVKRGASSGMLNFPRFPKSICTSVNHVAAHGIPGEETLNGGDVVKIDASVELDGVFGDNCRTYFVGTPSPKVKEITTVAYNAMMSGINQARPGNTIGDIVHAIDQSVKDTGYTTLKCCYYGHGIGDGLHMKPYLGYVKPGEGEKLEPGMIFTIEPIVVEAGSESHRKNGEILVNEGKLSAQFEHTVLVTEKGCEILTRSPQGIYLPPAIKRDVINFNGDGQTLS